MFWYEPGDKIPVALAECCREWIVPAYMKWNTCGLCDVKPTFKRMLPEEEWPVVPSPRRDALGHDATRSRDREAGPKRNDVD